MRVFLLSLLFTQVAFSQIKVVGYLPTYRWDRLEEIDYSHLSHLCAAFANPDEEGNMIFEKDLHQFVAVAHKNATKAIVSFCGGGDYSWGEKYKVYENLLATSANRTAFVQKIMDFTRLYKLDGIDNDMEGKAVELATYNVFSQELADSLHAGGFEYSCALGAYGQWGANNMNDTTLQKMDFVMTMSYGGVGNWNWKQAPDEGRFYAYERDVNYFIDRGYDKTKVLGGIPFYYTEFPKKAQSSYWQFNGMNCDLYKDEQLNAQDPFHSDTIISRDGNVTYLNSIETIFKKIDIAIKNNSGFMIWELGQDCFGEEYSLMKSISGYLQAHRVKTDISGLGRVVSLETRKEQTSFKAPFVIKEVSLFKEGQQIYKGKPLKIPAITVENADEVIFQLSVYKFVTKQLD